MIPSFRQDRPGSLLAASDASRWYFTAWRPVTAVIRAYVIGALGIPESDLSDMRYAYAQDVIEVRLWNHRRLLVAGADAHRYRWSSRP